MRKNFIPQIKTEMKVNSTWNKVIEEVKWMAVDFREERKWKIGMAFFLAKRIKKEKLQRETHQKEKKNAHKLMSSHLSQEIMTFWNKHASKEKPNEGEMEIEEEDKDILGIIDDNIAEKYEKGTIKHFINRNSLKVEFSFEYHQINRKSILEKLKKELARWPKNKSLLQNHQFLSSLLGKPLLSKTDSEVPTEDIPSLRESTSVLLENKKIKKKSKKYRWNSKMSLEGFELEPGIVKNFENGEELLNFFFDENEMEEGFKDLFPISVFFPRDNLDSSIWINSQFL